MVAAGGPGLLKRINSAAVLGSLIDHGPQTRLQLVERTGLSTPAVSRLLQGLSEEGSVYQDGTSASPAGPPAVLWKIKPEASIGGAIVVRAAEYELALRLIDGTVLNSTPIPTDILAPDDVITTIISSLSWFMDQHGYKIEQLSVLTIGLPGILDPMTGILVQSSALPLWQGVDLIGDLTALLPNCEVFTVNDASLVLVSHEEAQEKDTEVSTLLWFGDGVRQSTMIGQKVLVGAHGLAGEVGSVLVPTMGNGELKETGVWGTKLEDLLNDYPGGLSTDQLKPFAQKVAVGLLPAITILDPDVLYVAGPAIDHYGEPLLAIIGEELRKYVPLDITIAAAPRGMASMLDGALILSFREMRKRILDHVAMPAT